LKLFLNQLYPGGSDKKILGFKEIRYLENKIQKPYQQNFFNLLDFYQKLFINVRFIFNTRDHDEVAASQWWKNHDPSILKDYFRNYEFVTDLYSKQNTGLCYSITYEDVVKKSLKLRDLFYFLEEEYVEDRIDSVLSVKHSCG
jgi:hypothetical protein